MQKTTTAVIQAESLEALVGALAGRGFRVLGPTARDGAIVYDELETADDLPTGWTDSQDAGTYRLERRDDEEHPGIRGAEPRPPEEEQEQRDADRSGEVEPHAPGTGGQHVAAFPWELALDEAERLTGLGQAARSHR